MEKMTAKAFNYEGNPLKRQQQFLVHRRDTIVIIRPQLKIYTKAYQKYPPGAVGSPNFMGNWGLLGQSWQLCPWLRRRRGEEGGRLTTG